MVALTGIGTGTTTGVTISPNPAITVAITSNTQNNPITYGATITITDATQSEINDLISRAATLVSGCIANSL